MNAHPSPTESSPPTVGSVRLRPAVAMGLYAVLVSSALLVLWARQSDRAPAALAVAGPWVFLTFAVGFAAYRLALVMARRYSAFKAFLQLAIMASFFMLILSGGGGAKSVTGPLTGALVDPDPRIRALASELVGYRQEQVSASRLVELLEDKTPEVQRAAHDALVRLNAGADLGPADDADARSAWRDRFPRGGP